MEKTLVVSLAMACAYLNALFLANPTKAFRNSNYKAVVVLIGVLAGNLALMLWLNFNLAIAFMVWLPAIAGVLARKFLGTQDT